MTDKLEQAVQELAKQMDETSGPVAAPKVWSIDPESIRNNEVGLTATERNE